MRTCAFIFSLLISGAAFGQDSVATIQHQLRLSVDIFKPILNSTNKSQSNYEMQIDYNLKPDLYLVAEGGFGTSKYEYADLSYNSSGGFFRAGIDKSLLQRLGNNDWNLVTAGLRYGIGFIKRNEATYQYTDPFYGIVSGIIPSRNFTAHWIELTGGVKVALWQNLFGGWNIRGKFLLNSNSFRELPPAFVAGYGKGDHNTVFDFNFYIGWALRW